MHITAEDIIVEIVNSEGKSLSPGEQGEIVVTHLATTEFPFIRYRTGDIAVLDDRQCDCGRGLPLLKDIMGRTTDFIVASDGTLMHGLALIYVLRDLESIKAFKIVQENKNLVKVLLVPGTAFGTAIMDKIRKDFKLRLGESVDIEISIIETLPKEKSGKYRYVINKINTL